MKKLILFTLLIITTVVNAQLQPIILDGNFSDWKQISPAYTDALNDQASGNIDFHRLWIFNDDIYLLLRIEVGGEINLQNGNSITIYIDTDNNPSTGVKIDGIGAELEFTFGAKSGIFHSANGNISIGHNDIGLITAPTVTSTQFEIGIKRNTVIQNIPLFQSDTIEVVFKDNGVVGQDILPDENGGVKYVFKKYDFYPLPEYSIKKLKDNYLRIMTNNVRRDDFFNESLFAHYKDEYSAIAPDIIGFQEIYKHTAEETANRVASILPLSGGAKWYGAKSSSDVIVVSKFPITKVFPIDGNTAFLINLRPKYNTDLLFISAHPPCCNNDTGRQKEIDHIMKFIRNAKDSTGELALPRGTPIIIVGDMNLVGYAQQLKTFLTGDIVNNSLYGPSFKPDWDGSNFKDSEPLDAGRPTTFTWYSANSPYSPGKLDYIIYSGSVLQKMNGYVLFTKGMNPDTLKAYGLNPDDAVDASDHIPVVTDFQLSPVTSVKNNSDNILPEHIKLEQNYPNPFNPTTIIKYQIVKTGFVVLKVYNILGREVSVLVNKQQPAGEHKIEFNGSKLSSGVYYYQLRVNNFISTKKMILLK